MTTGNDDDVLAAALLQLAAQAEQITDLARRIETVTAVLARHAAAVSALGEIERQVTALASDIAALAANADDDTGTYRPEPAPPWWQMSPADREAAAGRLRAWAEQIYLPGYGHLAAALPPCWDQHPLCLFTLDWLCELWSALYLRPRRSPGVLASQAEWQTRLLPAAASQMAREGERCEHRGGPVRRPGPGAAPRRY